MTWPSRLSWLASPSSRSPCASSTSPPWRLLGPVLRAERQGPGPLRPRLPLPLRLSAAGAELELEGSGQTPRRRARGGLEAPLWLPGWGHPLRLGDALLLQPGWGGGFR